MNKKDILKEQLRLLSAQIMKAKLENKSQLKLRSEFAKLQREHKKLWLKEYVK
jgi:hypothetical protein